jgi:hypothetical protein
VNIPTDLVIWLKIAGTASTAVGSMLLAWRVKSIQKWVVYCLVAHEQSISQLRLIALNQQQDGDIVREVTKYLLDIESKLGIVLLVLGFSLLSIGMFAN